MSEQKPAELLKLLLRTEVYSDEEKMEKIEMLKSHVDRETFDQVVREWADANGHGDFAARVLWGPIVLEPGDLQPERDPNVCVTCGLKATATIIVDGDKYRLCEPDSVAWTKTLVSIQSIPAKEKPES